MSEEMRFALIFTLLIFVVGALVATSAVYMYNKQIEKADQYCKDNGWNKSEWQPGFRVCVKYLPHESGLGISKIYSGEILL